MRFLHDSEKDDEDGEYGEDDNDGGEKDLQLGEAGRLKHQHGGLASEVPVHVSWDHSTTAAPNRIACLSSEHV
jgi:hypothetical protein